MPLVKRSVSPASLCRNKIPSGIKNELECVTNSTLSGVISQLASLSQHAEDVFGELFVEANSFYGRANTLQDRIDKLSLKVTQLDSNVEEVSLHDINLRKAFKSSIITDQQVVSRQSMPQSLDETYKHADMPPPLQKLNVFRDDGRDGLKIYTDPDYFFDLWREAIQRETREAKERRREQRKKVRRQNPSHRQQQHVRAAVNTRMEEARKHKDGAEFIDYATASMKKTPMEKNSPDRQQNQINERRNSAMNKHRLNKHAGQNHDMGGMPPPPAPMDNRPQSNMYNAPPPPPPPVEDVPPPPTDIPLPTMPDSEMNDVPPPPPPVNIPSPPKENNTEQGPTGLSAQLQSVSLKKNTAPIPKVTDSRSDLLSAIRVGINLKKVEENERSTQVSSNANDVASILARRIAVEYSDSEESTSTFSDDEWD